MLEERESDYLVDDTTCIHCDYTVNYYDQVKEEATILLNKWNVEEPDDQMHDSDDWKCFIEEAIEVVVKDYRNIRTICDCCYDNEN